MTASASPIRPILGSILHPSDFSEASRVAFGHALKAALVAKASLAMLHVAPTHSDSDWSAFPGVRETLERWKILPPNSPRSAVPDLGINVRKVVAVQSDPAKMVLDFLETHPTDLVVLAHHQRAGLMGWIRRSVSEPVARMSGEMTLFIPDGCPGFVNIDDGSVSLNNILVPVAAEPRAQTAVSAAARMARSLQRPEGRFTVLHVGEDAMPVFECPDVPGWTWDIQKTTGSVIDEIILAAKATRADAIVMATNGRDGFLDALRGSNSERVLQKSPCPLLVIPEASPLVF
ncbi:MAG: universal stress protein [Gemmataceae bacterium]|nr:universal stress protein [Gemmataceae bacterium]